jgi:hypothetical protein
MRFLKIIEDALAEIAIVLERASFWLLVGTLAVVMSLFVWAALSWPAPVSFFYRLLTATTILVGTAILEYFIIRLAGDEKNEQKKYERLFKKRILRAMFSWRERLYLWLEGVRF